MARGRYSQLPQIGHISRVEEWGHRRNEKINPFAEFQVKGANVLMALTEREREIVRLVSKGLSNKAIARQLNISHGTIKVHLHHVYQKLEIDNRTVLARLHIIIGGIFA